ncbi:MAG TPA: hypothetical protein VFH34_12680 [Anaerolineales bacterium]|nr:hypothetical protein [Anaerolineales bacterium]
MPKPRGWCDEASVTHGNEPPTNLLDWQAVWRCMVAEGRMSKVNGKPASTHVPAR